MARLSDVPIVMRTVGPLPFLKRIFREVLDDNLFTLAGGLAYSWLFAIFPFLVFLMNVFPLMVDRHQEHEVEQTKSGMRVFIFAALPDPAANMIWTHMDERIKVIIKNPSGSIAFVSLAIALWAASKGIGVTMAAMERCYELEKGRAFYTRRPMAFGLTVLVSGLVCLLVLLLPAGTTFKGWMVGQNESVSYWALWVFDVLRGGLAIAAVLMILAVFYHFGPGVKHRWQYLSPGSIFVFVMWILVGLVFRYYVNRFGQTKYQETYGAVGGTAILLLLFYIDALVLLIGAQINSELDFEVLKVPRGSRNFRVDRAGLNGDDDDEFESDYSPHHVPCAHGAD